MHTARQRGAALLVAVMLILAVAAMGAIVAGSISGSDITDSHLTGYGIEAQFAAESGVERALELFANAAYAPPPAAAVNPCVAGSFAAGAGPFSITSGRTFTTTFKAATDFDGVTLLPFSQCRVQVTGAVTGTGISRTVQAVLDRNLAAGANPGFNDIVGGGATAITGWTSAATLVPFDVAGGPDTAPAAAIPTRCTRAGYAVKSRNAPGGNIPAQGTGLVAIIPNFRVTTGVAQTVTVRFNYRVITIGTAAGNVCTTTWAGVAVPGGATNDMNVWFRLTDSANNQYTTVAARVFGAAATGGTPLLARNVGNALPCTPTTQQATAAADYGTCAGFYGAGTPTNKGQSTVDIAAASTGFIKQLEYFIFLRAAGTAREAWIDNIELINATGSKVGRTAEWRDCSVSSCP